MKRNGFSFKERRYVEKNNIINGWGTIRLPLIINYLDSAYNLYLPTFFFECSNRFKLIQLKILMNVRKDFSSFL